MFDSFKSPLWKGTNYLLSNKNIYIKSNGNINQKFAINPGTYKVCIIGKNNIGTSELNVQIISDNFNFILNEKLTFSKSLSEKIYFIDIEKSMDCIIKIFKRPGDSGTTEINKISILSNASNIQIKNNNISEKRDNKKSLGILIPYEIYGGAEVYIKTILDNIDTGSIDIHILYMKNNPIKNIISDPNIQHKVLSSKENLSSYIKIFDIQSLLYYNSIKAYRYALFTKKENINVKLYEIYHSDFKWSDSLSNLNIRDGVDIVFRTSPGYLNNFSNNLIDLPVPINIDLFDYNEKQDMQLPNNNKIIGTVARLSQEKNISYIFSLAKIMQEYNFVIFGDGPLFNGLSAIIKNNNIKNIFLMGHNKNVHLFYKNFDYFLLPSLFEGTPISILEAMVSEVPVFATDVGEIRRLWGDKINFISLNAALDSEAIKTYKTDNVELKKYKNFVIENNSSKVIANNFLNIIFNEHYKYNVAKSSTEFLPGFYI
jgi:glycosyltransferase involved in cell wall biosynthesis